MSIVYICSIHLDRIYLRACVTVPWTELWTWMMMPQPVALHSHQQSPLLYLTQVMLFREAKSFYLCEIYIPLYKIVILMSVAEPLNRYGSLYSKDYISRVGLYYFGLGIPPNALKNMVSL